MSEIKIHHIAITTNNILKLKKFYENLPGFPKAEINYTPKGQIRSLWFHLDDTILMIEKGKIKKAPFALIFTLGSSEKFKKEFNKILHLIQKKTLYTVYISDPDGNAIGFSSFPKPLKLG